MQLVRLVSILILSSALYLSIGCGKSENEAKAAGAARAIYISGPAGAECFAIVDGDDKVVGGNCK